MGAQTSLLIPVALFLWFAWRGFEGMMDAEPMGWKWIAGLLGGLASSILVFAGLYGLFLITKRSIRSNSARKLN